MWTHTTLDNMANVCPLRHLPCTSTADLVSQVNYVNASGVELDYWDHFLVPGTHGNEGKVIDPEAGNCDWVVKADGSTTPWPMTRADCTIALDQAQKNKQAGMVAAIQLFHKSSKKDSMDALLCSYRMMASDGNYPGGACDVSICGDPAINHYFGAYFA
jgi:hypothetical protein